MLPLARLSLRLLLIGAVCFGALNYAAYAWQQRTFDLHLTGMGVLLWLVINVVGYRLIAVAARATARRGLRVMGRQTVHRREAALRAVLRRENLVIPAQPVSRCGLAPLVVITLAGIIFTLLAPVLASYTLFVTVGNISGAAGDIWSVQRIARLPATALVEDTEAGYRAWELTA